MVHKKTGLPPSPQKRLRAAAKRTFEISLLRRVVHRGSVESAEDEQEMRQLEGGTRQRKSFLLRLETQSSAFSMVPPLRILRGLCCENLMARKGKITVVRQLSSSHEPTLVATTNGGFMRC